MKEADIEKMEALCEIQEPSVQYKDSFLAALEEYHKENKKLDEGVKDPGSDFELFVKNLKEESLGINLKEGRVPQTTYWIIDKDGYAGRVSIRHELNEKLLKEGGHIGYGVIPSKRGQGYGNKALELVLPKARALGLEKVLITCDSTNTASRKIIGKNGGVLENEIPGEGGKPSKLRFWIKLNTEV
jgi:predicted acetyltransferase